MTVPSSLKHSEMRPRQESWPPTQVRFSPSMAFKKRSQGGLRPLLEDIDENPLTYFLTPMDCDDMGLDDEDMYFDAGIEDASQPCEAIRSLSPSSLEGLRKTNSRPISLDFDSDVATTDDDDDEDYYTCSHFSPSCSPTSGFSPLRARDSTVHGFHFGSRRPSFFGPTPDARKPAPAQRLAPGAPSSSSPSTTPALHPSLSMSPRSPLSPLSPLSSSPSSSCFFSPPTSPTTPSSSTSRRGRPSARTPRWQHRGPHATPSPRSRPNHLWQEPSSSVWSIEEETQEELMSEVGSSSEAGFDGMATNTSKEARRTTTKTLKKKVRFVLPVEE